MQPYPKITSDDATDLYNAMAFISRARINDITDWNNLENIFMRGRKVGKVPTGSADIAATDKVGDFNYSTTYLYLCVDNAGTAVWRRVALSSW